MTLDRHGLSVGIKKVDEEFLLTFSIAGKLTHEDYEVFVPMLEMAIEGVKHPHIKAMVDIRELDGWELRAAWDDLKLGLKHGKEFTKVALLGNGKWEEMVSKIGAWFISGDVKYFEDKEEAWSWLTT